MLRRMRDHKLRIALITHPQDVSYLSGFEGEDSFLLLAAGGVRSRGSEHWGCLITDRRYDEQACRECPGIEIHVRKGPMVQAVGELLKHIRPRRLAVQSEHMTLQLRSQLEKQLNRRTLVPIGNMVSFLREVKDASEIELIRKAIRVAETAFRRLLKSGAKGLLGRSERDIAGELDYLMRREGADSPAFETIVAVGANASLPHYRPGASRVRRNQVVLIDWGARVAGYCSDLTRTVAVGKIPPKLAEIYQVVLRAQRAGLAKVRSGVSGKTPDAAARRTIGAAQYGDKFVHGLGHGLGRQVHEGPVLNNLSRRRLRAGMVVTVEPGIYLPGIGGVRIEDDVLITHDGYRRLSTLPREQAAMTLR